MYIVFHLAAHALVCIPRFDILGGRLALFLGGLGVGDEALRIFHAQVKSPCLLKHLFIRPGESYPPSAMFDKHIFILIYMC